MTLSNKLLLGLSITRKGHQKKISTPFEIIFRVNGSITLKDIDWKSALYRSVHDPYPRRILQSKLLWSLTMKIFHGRNIYFTKWFFLL